MSQYHKLSFLICTIGCFFYACDPCGSLDCSSGQLSSQFKFLNGNTGKNLLFGPNKIYDTSQVKLFAVRGRDTTYYSFSPYFDTGNTNDTALHVEFYLRTDTAFIRFGITDVDTLTFSFEKYDTKCCKNQIDITSIRYNNSITMLPNKGVLEIRK